MILCFHGPGPFKPPESPTQTRGDPMFSPSSLLFCDILSSRTPATIWRSFTSRHIRVKISSPYHTGMTLHSPAHAELASLAQQFNILFEALRSRQNTRYREIQNEFTRHCEEISEDLKHSAYPSSRGHITQILDFCTREVEAHKPGIMRALKTELYAIAGKMWRNMVLGLYVGDMEEPGFWPEGAISQLWPHLVHKISHLKRGI